MHDALNFFDPNKDIPAHDENQLTRAFLVVLRISPAAHQVWLSLAAPDRKLYELPRPWSFDTQRWQMFSSVPEVAEPIEGISVLQAADVQVVDGPVQITDRPQVLDGIVRYGDELLIVVETEPDGPVATRQAQDLNVHGAHVRFAGDVRTHSLLARPTGRLVRSGRERGRCWFLATAAKIAVPTVKRFETGVRTPIPVVKAAIVRALEDAGVIFESDSKSIGVKLKTKRGK
jgi:hypothetical protein